MEPALKQRLIGAAVLVAIAVIFLPMLIKGPAPDSGVSDISLDLPSTPKQGFETRELPLVTPPARNGGNVTAPGAKPSGEGALPTVDTRAARDSQDQASGMTPATVAAGNYAVSFGSYASQEDAQKVVGALQAAGFPAFQESVKSGERTLHRVRIGPFQTSAAAETARIDSVRVRKDVGAKVVVLDADRAGSAAASTSAEKAPAQPAQPVAAKPEPKPEPPKPKPAEPAKPEPAKPVATAPAPAPAKPEPAPAGSQPAPAAAGVGFVVQLGAFGNPAEATALRDRARSQGLSAFVEQVRSGDTTLNRVQVGPVADRVAADQLKAQAAAKLGISGFVRAHP
ncbi:SPOR domain-containing protein [Lysobacter ciconiae]|uniref:SPOR domain-containing protein n=1 Tax=Novilysobacter ciconiae TaxID=2781022 RepID=A0A7S6UGQ5_9GAMM|nr:SPOR domain-containing protein [Lysobacter ciconiae]QOW19988.1 SPOR domain-containing protein [Lysobacter ciconiae]